jgi:3-oxoacyl-[acyl-carrier protein] reductase
MNRPFDLASAAEIVEAAGDAVRIGAAVSSEAALTMLREACLSSFGQVDVIMNNVGVSDMGPPESLPDEAWHRANPFSR